LKKCLKGNYIEEKSKLTAKFGLISVFLEKLTANHE